MALEENSLDSVDTEQVAADIAAGLGFSGKADPSSEADPPSEADPDPAASPQSAADGPAPGTAAFDAMPKAWKKEMEAHWSRLDPEVRKYVNSREADVSRGIQMYQQGHSSWNRLLSPYAQIFQAYPDLDPVQMLQGVMNQHLRMAQGTPEQKREIALQILKSYGVDLAQGAPAPGDEVQTLQKRVAQLESFIQSAQNNVQRQTYEKQLSAVEAFSQDPKNAHWNDVVEDVLLLVKKGAASTLQEAYELACLRNPEVRAKVVTASAPAPAPTKAANFPNLNGSSATPRARKLTMDETIGSVINKHYPSH